MDESTNARSLAGSDYASGDVIFGKYKLERLLGQGAQGSVWLAENLALDAPVAIKIVAADPENPASTLRLEKEARAAAQVVHAAVVRVFDLGETPNGDAFIVMEFLEGQNLGERLDLRGRLSAVDAVRTLLPIADVLHVAHTRGIVHRDLKPENVFLAKAGQSIQPKLLDFGIAKLRRPTRAGRPITEVGMLVGSPGYISPEQASCRDDVGPAADIWSFSVVLYECVTGTLPFAADNYREILRRIEEDEPEPIVAHGVGDYELWEIIRRGLSKSPAERWPSMQLFGQELAKWLTKRGVRDDVSGVLLESRWLAKCRSELASWHETTEPSSTVRVRRRAASSNEPRKRGLRRGAAGAAAATALLAVLVGWSAAKETSEATEAAASGAAPAPAPTEALPGPLAPPPVAAPAAGTDETNATRTAAVSEPAPAPFVTTPRAMPDGGVPKRRARRVPNDLLNPY
jgi:serine/threonine-protein kinase